MIKNGVRPVHPGEILFEAQKRLPVPFLFTRASRRGATGVQSSTPTLITMRTA